MTTTPTVWKQLGQANTTDSGPAGDSQANSRVVALSGGGYVAIWEDNTDAFFGLGARDIIGRIFDALGNPVGGEFVASLIYNDFDQQLPDITALANGGFAVAYQTEDAAGAGDGQNIDVDIFDASGGYLGHNDFRQGFGGPAGIDDTAPSITAFADGGYALVYEKFDGVDRDLVGYVVNPAGVIGPEFDVEASAEAGVAPDLATLSNGDFVAVYQRANTPGSTNDVRYSIRTAAGGLISDALIGAAALTTATEPAVTALAGGGFVVAWQDDDVGGPGIAGFQVEVLTNAGVSVDAFSSADISAAVGSLGEPALTMLADGGFVVGWLDDDTSTIHGHRFDAAGVSIGSEFAMKGTTNASSPQFALLDDGRFVVTLTDTDAGGNQDVFTTIWDPRTSPIEGSNGDDVLTSRTDGATVNGLEGADTIFGNVGDDTLDGDGGADTISGGDGSDTISGGGGNDTLYGHSVADLDPTSGNIEATLLANIGAGAVFLTSAPGDDGFAYALKKDTGEIIRIDTATGAQNEFLDIPDDQLADGNERGLLGLAFHPDYDTNGRFFVFVTNAAGNLEVREYERSAGDPTVANAAPVNTLLTIAHPSHSNHNGGFLGFGPDGMLYITTGDGGGSNDPDGNAQNLASLLGKILRIDVNGDDFPGDTTRDYAIPGDNPFAGATPGADEIWDYGLRNPWRISFDSATGDLYIGDVGQGAREEVDFEAAGGHGGFNYGWDFREGLIQGPSPPPNPPNLTDPVFDYAHPFGEAITGGYVYRGPAAGLQGGYFFGDYVTKRLMTLRVINGEAQGFIDHTAHVTGATLGNISSFGTDNAGNLYVVTLAGQIYRLNPGIAAGDGADTINGGAGDDHIFGGMGNDILIGGTGADTMTGGADDDLYYVDDAGDVVIEAAGQGTLDQVATVISYTLAAGIRVEKFTTTSSSGTSALNLTGNEFAQIITGNAAANVINGRGGTDTMTGLGGSDLYYVDKATDVVVEGAGQGAEDQVATSVSYTLGAGVEVERFVTTNAGGASAIDLTGNGFNQTIVGNAGINVLKGGGGTDLLQGLGGNDTYFVDSAADVVTESTGQGSADIIAISVSYVMGSATQVETLRTTSNSGTSAIDLTGNGFNQTIVGNAGINVLKGGGGTDVLQGLGGNDTYFVDSATDVVSDGTGQGSADIIAISVSYVMGSATQVETLRTTSNGGTATINLTGNDFNQTIVGNAGINTINSRAGNDILTGLGGADAFVFDRAIAAGNVDHITDFAHAQDKIRLDHDIFATLAIGALSSSAFKDISSAAEDASDRILYEHATGALYYDADGAGGAAAQLFAILDSLRAIITSADFLVIA